MVVIVLLLELEKPRQFIFIISCKYTHGMYKLLHANQFQNSE